MAGDAAAVHRARVATRRLREALPVVDGERRAVRRLRRDLRDLTRALGPVRELDVTLGLVVRLLHDEPSLESSLDALRVRLMERRARRRARMLRAVERIEVAGLLSRVGALAPAGAGASPPLDREAIRRRIAGRARALDAAVGRAGALYAPEPLHAVRIAVKKLRYALELGRAARIRGVVAQATRLRRFQDLLGEWHDWQVLATIAARVQGSTPVDDHALADLTALLSRVEDRCRALHAEFLAARGDLTALADEIAARVPAGREP